MKRYEVLIFATGAVTLALELLASRIMTPYFGVSLYIWTGILAITLVFLAVGYRFGGKLSQGTKTGRDLEVALLAMPIYSALAIVVAAAVYPALFPQLSQFNLIVGSFVAAACLLAVPLIMLSALNPILIGLQRGGADGGDAGAGRIFFISTIGSVFGVLLTAFLFIPNLTNYRAILLLGLLLCGMVALFAWRSAITRPGAKGKLAAGSLAVAVLCAAFLVGKDGYLRLISSSSIDGQDYKVLAEYTSMFGNIKVAEVRNRDGSGGVERHFIQDGLIQNRATPDHQSMSMYTHILQSLAQSYAPKARSAIVFGLGAGIVPRNFSRRGLEVAVVEINPMALLAAREHFGFRADGIDVVLEDARTHARNCRSAYDIGILDLFQGDSVPDYLLTKEFFADLKGCLKPDGVLVMNTTFNPDDDEPNFRLMATIASAFPGLYVSGFLDGNIFIVGRSVAKEVELKVADTPIPKEIESHVRFAVSQSKLVPAEVYRHARPISDDHNIFSVLFSDTDMAERSYMVGSLPPAILVN